MHACLLVVIRIERIVNNGVEHAASHAACVHPGKALKTLPNGKVM